MRESGVRHAVQSLQELSVGTLLHRSVRGQYIHISGYRVGHDASIRAGQLRRSSLERVEESELVRSAWGPRSTFDQNMQLLHTGQRHVATFSEDVIDGHEPNAPAMQVIELVAEGNCVGIWRWKSEYLNPIRNRA